MVAPIIFWPRSALEIGILFVLAIACVVAGIGIQGVRQAHARLAAMFGLYFSLGSGLVLLGHCLFGSAPFVVSPYALTLLAGAIAAWSILLPRLRAVGLPLGLVLSILLGCLVLGVVGGRIVDVLAALPRDVRSLSELGARLSDRHRSGLGVFGAFALDTLFLVILFRRHPEHSLARTLDAGASAIAVNLAIGRAGCLFAGCCYGAPTEPSLLSLPARVFLPESPAGVAYAASPDVAVWATQPMEAALVFGIAAGCEALYRRRARLGLHDGMVIATAAASYGFIRALLESIRADSPRVIAGVLTVWQALGLSTAALATAWMLLAGRHRTHEA